LHPRKQEEGFCGIWHGQLHCYHEVWPPCPRCICRAIHSSWSWPYTHKPASFLGTSSLLQVYSHLQFGAMTSLGIGWTLICRATKSIRLSYNIKGFLTNPHAKILLRQFPGNGLCIWGKFPLHNHEEMTEMYLLYPSIVALTYNLHNPSPVQTLEQWTNIRRRMIRVNQNLQGKKKRKEPRITLLMQTCPKTSEEARKRW
jgi:hypothetical protein